jgi:4-amino-4-deoxy-L-arabinose transferase-like glycosyltransferase
MTAAPTPARAGPLSGLQPATVSLVLRGGAVALSLGLMLVALATRPLLPIDETRYLTVAWEMFRSGDYLVPHLNGELYSHKPPMMSWLINLAWAVTGPNEFAARLVPALFVPISVALTSVLGDRIGGRELGDRAGFTAAGLLVLAVLGSLAMFDAMLTAAAIAALIGFVDAAKGRPMRGFLIAGLAMGAGILVKGPAILLHTLPVALAAPLWAPRQRSWGRWYAMVAGSVVLTAAVALAWALPAAHAGGPAFGKMLIWGQTAGRVASADADHASPIWLYAAFLPLLLAPWILSRTIWSAALAPKTKAPPNDAERLRRLPWIAGLSSLVLFTLISAKQPHYLLPALPAVALIAASLIGRAGPQARSEPLFGIAVAILGAFTLAASQFPNLAPKDAPMAHLAPGLLLLAASAVVFALRSRVLAAGCVTTAAVFVGFHLVGYLDAFASQDLTWAGNELRARPGGAVAFVGDYHGELGFKGRLTAPVAELSAAQAPAWLAQHPDAMMFAPFKKTPQAALGAPAEVHPYRGGFLGVWKTAP